MIDGDFLYIFYNWYINNTEIVDLNGLAWRKDKSWRRIQSCGIEIFEFMELVHFIVEISRIGILSGKGKERKEMVK